MQQGRGGLVGHPRIAVDSAGGDTFEHREDGSHCGTVSSALTKGISDVS